MILTAIKMVTKTFEITLVDPISPAELEWLEVQVTDEDWIVAVNQNHRILLIEGPETIYEVITALAEHEFLHDIGLIREICDYEPVYDEDEMLIQVEFDND